MRFGKQAKLFRHFDQRGDRIRLHLGHHPVAVNFNRNLARPQVVCNLFIQHACCHQLHHLSFTRRKLLETTAQLRQFALYFAMLSVSFDCLTDGVK